MKNFLLVAASAACCVMLGCQSLQQGVYREDLMADSGEPAYITVQHCLIGFQGTMPGPIRSREEAEQLAVKLLESARAGEDFDVLVRENTDDSPPGIYKLANHGFEGDTTSRVVSKQVFPRSSMVPAFGDVGFPLKVGEYGLAAFDPDSSPYGWHIIKRIK